MSDGLDNLENALNEFEAASSDYRIAEQKFHASDRPFEDGSANAFFSADGARTEAFRRAVHHALRLGAP